MHLWSIIGAVLVVVILHELGHAVMMRRYGIELEEFGIGLPIKGLSFAFLLPAWLGGVRLRLSPLLLGAYVRPAGETNSSGEHLSIKRLPVRAQKLIYMGGILANVLTFFVCWGVLFVRSIISSSEVVKDSFARFSFDAAINLGIFLAVVALSKASIIVLRLVVVGLLGWFCFAGSLAGPVGIVQSGMHFATNTWSLIGFAAIISIGLAAMNLVPFIPFDGGRVANLTVRSWERRRGKLRTFYYVSGFAFGVILFVSLIKDFGKLF